jgi:hypothetical protein
MEKLEQFNSSDIEFSPVQKRFANAGSFTIASMRETLFEDGISSKKRVRGLTDSRGAPGTQYARSIWLNRIENYMKDNKMLYIYHLGEYNGPCPTSLLPKTYYSYVTLLTGYTT